MPFMWAKDQTGGTSMSIDEALKIAKKELGVEEMPIDLKKRKGDRIKSLPAVQNKPRTTKTLKTGGILMETEKKNEQEDSIELQIGPFFMVIPLTSGREEKL